MAAGIDTNDGAWGVHGHATRTSGTDLPGMLSPLGCVTAFSSSRSGCPKESIHLLAAHMHWWAARAGKDVAGVGKALAACSSQPALCKAAMMLGRAVSSGSRGTALELTPVTSSSAAATLLAAVWATAGLLWGSRCSCRATFRMAWCWPDPPAMLVCCQRAACLLHRAEAIHALRLLAGCEQELNAAAARGFNDERRHALLTIRFL